MVVPVGDKEADAYFSTRPRGAQIGAWASLQSQSLESREVLEARIQEFTQKFEGQDVPRPPHWSGYRVQPQKIEFWQQGDDRLHTRVCYKKQGASWEKEMLYP